METPPPLPNKPDEPYSFADFIHVVQKDIYYGRAIHQIIKFGRESVENQAWAMAVLADHVVLPDFELDQLGLSNQAETLVCSNTTTFFMLDFCRYA